MVPPVFDESEHIGMIDADDLHIDDQENMLGDRLYAEEPGDASEMIKGDIFC